MALEALSPVVVVSLTHALLLPQCVGVLVVCVGLLHLQGTAGIGLTPG